MFQRSSPLRLASLQALLALAALFGLLLLSAPARALEGLDIVTSTGVHHFEVEIAADDKSREQGLMFRKFLPEDRGMLFEFDRVEPLGFWMHNTYISLDIIFIGADGVVRHIADHAEPLSDALIPSGAPCKAVLEVSAGTAARIGLQVGDEVQHPFFGK